MITANEMIGMLQQAIKESGDKNMPVFVRAWDSSSSGATELSAEIQVGHCDNEWDDVTPTVPCLVIDAEDENDTVEING